MATWKTKDISEVSDMSSDDRTQKDTPVPGHYDILDFIEEADLNPVRKTYGFKGLGRKAHTQPVRHGDILLPGAYNYNDSIQEVLKRQTFYSFKNCPRLDITLGIRDKNINTSPCDYNVAEKPVEKIPCKHVMFRSTVPRISFLPRTPGPGTYKPSWQAGHGLDMEALGGRGPGLFFRDFS